MKKAILIIIGVAIIFTILIVTQMMGVDVHNNRDVNINDAIVPTQTLDTNNTKLQCINAGGGTTCTTK